MAPRTLTPDQERGRLFTVGCDVLFPGGSWPDNKPGGLLVADRRSRVEVFDQLPDETWVYPGHGGDTTLGAERPSLPEWKARGG